MKTIKHLLWAVALVGAACIVGNQLGQAAQQPKTVTSTPGNPAGVVYVTAKGKSYHTYRDCIGLERAKTVYEASELTAQQHGLTLCGICAHRHHSKTVGDNNGSWAKPEAK